MLVAGRCEKNGLIRLAQATVGNEEQGTAVK